MRVIFVLLIAVGILAVACGDGAGSDSGPPQVEGNSFQTPGGVLVIELASGSEQDPVAPGDVVQMHYTGWLADGTQFDSSYDRGTPFTFTLGARQVIQGWEEGVEGMSPGDERRLVIPSDLAYGAQARGEIPPNAELTFDIALIAFARPSPTQPAPEITDGDTDTPSFTTAGGVVVVEVQQGPEQDPAQPGDTVDVHYTGWLDDGTQFDSSRDRGPFTFQLGAGNVIQGWEEGVDGMSPGDIRRLVIPPELAYGAQDRGTIPANSILTFEVEMLSITRAGE